jgi:REP element-mobilizing transposase RayT
MDSFHQRHLPHFQPADGTFFCTFRLANSLPIGVVNHLRARNVGKQEMIGGMPDKRERRIAWLELQSEYFALVEESLEISSYGPQWLSRSDIAQIVVDSINFAASQMVDLHAYTVMPNHVHLAFSIGHGVLGRHIDAHQLNCEQVPYPVSRIIGSIKKYTARKSNKILGRAGQFWQDESYDRWVRDLRELRKSLWYIIQNPVRARLVKDWREWRWTYCDESLLWP